MLFSLVVCVAANTEEHRKLQKAHECSKDILAHVNHYVQECENKQKLYDLQRRLDRRPIENSTHPTVSEYKVTPLSLKVSLSLIVRRIC